MPRLTTRSLRVAFGDAVALDNVDLDVPSGSTMGLVGESGSGKSTLARAILQLVPFRGQILIDGRETAHGSMKDVREFRRQVQMIFQDPSGSLDPRMTVGQSLREALTLTGNFRRSALLNKTERALELVHLGPDLMDRYPYQLSGGQKQRVTIARALAVEPSILVLDEVTSALDVSAQAAVLNLLRELQVRFKLTFLFISHNLATVRYMSRRVAVMFRGRIVEEADASEFFVEPRHPYSQILMAAVPALGKPLPSFRFGVDTADTPRSVGGCRFQSRCPVGPAQFPDRSICQDHDPQPRLVDPGFRCACHFGDANLRVLHAAQ